MPSNHIQVVHKKMSKRRIADILERRADANSCSNFYISPTMGQVVNALDPLPITWDPTCLSAPAIDIYLYSPGADFPRIHVWEGVALSRGTYNATLVPSWWNSTSSQSLQVDIVPAGQPTFLSTLPGGPIFNATYTPPASGAPPADSQVSSGVTQVNDLYKSKSALTPGKKAAAALFTLLFFIGLGIAGYIKYKRHKGKNERKRWTEAVDKRMSTISTDWKSVSVAGANAAIRNSIAVGSRSSAFSFGAIRPSSTFAVEGDDEKRSMSQMRTGVGLRNITPISTERVSRVSFAPDTRLSRSSIADSRPSGESRRTRLFHTGYVPPVPSLPDPADLNDTDAVSLSPRQSQGPMALTPEDIRSRIAANKRSRSLTANEPSNDIDDVMPALRMMRTGSDPSLPDDLLLTMPEPVQPIQVVTSVAPSPPPITSPVMPVIPMEPIPANVMSPDEMLRVYAERKNSMAAGMRLTPSPTLTSSTGSINYPKAVVKKRSIRASLKGAGNTMRGLYNATRSLSPTTPTTSSPTFMHGPTAFTNNLAFAESPTAMNEEGASAYRGVADGQYVSPFEVYEGENAADGVDSANPHPFGYHPHAYSPTSHVIEEDEGVGEVGPEAVYFGQAK